VEEEKRVCCANAAILPALTLGDRRRICGWTKPAVVTIHLGTDIGEATTLFQSTHDILCDVYTDAAAQGMLFYDTGLLPKATVIGLMAHRTTPTVAGNLGEDVRIGGGEAIGSLYPLWRPLNHRRHGAFFSHRQRRVIRPTISATGA